MFHNPSPVVVISVVTELRKEKGKEGASADWCSYALRLSKCVCRNLLLDLLKNSWSLEMLLSVSSVVTRMN